MKKAVNLPESFVKWLFDRKAQICHRQLLVITGDHDWVKNSINLIRPLLTNDCLYVGESDWPARCQNANYRTQLGSEFDFLIYDVFSGIRANSLIALSGTVKSGGLMILLAPNLESWPEFTDPDSKLRTSYGYDGHNSKSNFIKWLTNRINTDDSVCVLSKSGFTGITKNVTQQNAACKTKTLTTSDQQNAIEKIVSNYHLNTTFQLVITADRGRGKSATLGLAAQRLFDQTNLNIAVTAPNKLMTHNVFKHLDNPSNIFFKPFDELLSSKQKFDLVFVDEAAAIPTPILISLLDTFPKIVFSTTTHGYEGSGKGFELRFTPYLRKLSTYVETYTLQTPIRWFENDVLESFWFKTMLMTPLSGSNVELKDIQNKLTSRIISSEELINNSGLFFQVFQLLVNAHYQTTPDDLVRLLDAQEQHVHITTTADAEVVAVALISLEGGNKLDDIDSAISEGRRRVNGHLIPQRLAFLRCSPSLARKKYTRIIRIAVRYDYRRLNIASRLVDHIIKWSNEAGIDFVGASFAATRDVIKFWQSNHFHPVHLGLKKDASSGAHSLIVLRRCNVATETNQSLDEIISFLVGKFSQELSYQRDYRLSKVDLKIIELLSSQAQLVRNDSKLDKLDRKILDQFCSGLRPLFSCEYQLSKLVKVYSQRLEDEVKPEYEFLKLLLNIKWSYSKIKDHYLLSGKKQIEEHARKCCLTILQTIKKTL